MKLALSSLCNLCYYALPEEQVPLLKDLYLQPLPDWDYYYNLINRDFPVPRDYFFLPLTQGRDCCQRKRYVEVYTKFKLIPDSVHSKFGVYEPYAALEEAVMRNDVEMAKYYYSLLPVEVKPRIRNIYWKFRKIVGKEFNFRMAALEAVWLLHFGSTEYFPAVVENWQKHTEEVSLGLTNLDMSVYDCVTEKKTGEALSYLISQDNQEAFFALMGDDGPVMSHKFLPSVLASGREDFVKIYSRFINNKRVAEEDVDYNVSSVNIASKEASDSSYYQPLLASSIKGGNPHLFIYCMAMPYDGPVSFHDDLLQGMRERINPVGFYQILQLVRGEKEAKVLYPDVDMNLNYMKTHRIPISLVRDTILENPGYLPFVEYVKKAYPKADAQWKQLATQIDEVVYPLTAKLLAM
nr:hypothetical protein Cbor_435 [Cedratvirus borely]